MLQRADSDLTADWSQSDDAGLDADYATAIEEAQSGSGHAMAVRAGSRVAGRIARQPNKLTGLFRRVAKAKGHLVPAKARQVLQQIRGQNGARPLGHTGARIYENKKWANSAGGI